MTCRTNFGENYCSRDEANFRPRVNKKMSSKDRDQKASGMYFVFDVDEDPEEVMKRAKQDRAMKDVEKKIEAKESKKEVKKEERAAEKAKEKQLARDKEEAEWSGKKLIVGGHWLFV